ncbi:flagellar basal body L-ring protein FlgH [Planctomicrobium sp. SH664]|uniref:flagellar basal body L-ring protein FlgH n=1 Tax=Planctomicrobium sp. SH664 TaxID=3448125 RepID=UPI003F5ADEC9
MSLFNSQSRLVLGCLALSCSTTARVFAENIWQQRTPNNGFLFYDSKARNIGDQVTVLIAQNTDIANVEDRGMSKSTSSKGLFNFKGASDGGFGTQGASASLDTSLTSGRKFDGQSGYTAGQEITDRLTCTVMDVLPNGDLVIAGERRTRIAGEERILTLTGIIRGLDIGPDNSIAWRYVSQARLDYETGGPSQKFTRQGWLGRATNVVWPF